ncbi:MAG: hypothetical protein RR992_01590, partial [Clostridiales bacterium]
MKKHNNSFLWRGKIFSKKDIEKLKKDNVWIWWVAMIMLTAFILVIPALGSSDTYNVGEICDNTIYYEGNTLSYMSDVKYQQAKDAVEDQLSPVYVLDAQKIIDAKGRIANFVGEIAKIQDSKDDHNPLYQSLLGNHFSEKTV